MATIFTRILDTVGDGSGTKNANGDYSSASQDFLIRCPVGGVQWDNDFGRLLRRVTYGGPRRDILYITRMLVTVQDAANMRAEHYGTLGTALATGITVLHRDSEGATLTDLTDGAAITSNAGWGAFCYDVDIKAWGAGDELLLARWTFAKQGQDARAPDALELVQGDSLTVRIGGGGANDNLAGLVLHRFTVQGYFE